MESVKLKQQLITYLEEEKVYLISHSTTNVHTLEMFHVKYYDVGKEDYKGLAVVYVYACAAHCMQMVKQQFCLVIDIFH